MTKYLILLIAILTVLYIISKDCMKESFAGSLIQLYSKGYQDVHLTNDAWLYYPWLYDYYYPTLHPYDSWRLNPSRGSNNYYFF